MHNPIGDKVYKYKTRKSLMIIKVDTCNMN
jgi:hypothetical protein